MRALEISFIMAVSLLISDTSGQIIKSPTRDRSRTLTFPARQSLDSMLKNFLETKLREIMIEGNEKLDIPVMDPLHGYHQQLNFNIDKIMLSVNFNEYHVEELSKYEVKGSSINVFKRRIEVRMNFPTITAHGVYNLDGFLDDNTSIFGHGDFNMTMTDFYYSAVAYVATFGGIRVTSLDLKIHLKELDLSMSGLMDDEENSWILSEVFSDIIPKMIDEYHDEIVDTVSPKVIAMMNSKLEGMSLNDLVSIIS